MDLQITNIAGPLLENAFISATAEAMEKGPSRAGHTKRSTGAAGPMVLPAPFFLWNTSTVYNALCLSRGHFNLAINSETFAIPDTLQARNA